MFHFKEIPYGFEWGPAKITRIISDMNGWIMLGIDTPKKSLQIYVTKTGKIRVFDKKGEWQCPTSP